MKRVKAACICQTLHFQLKDDIPREYAAELAQKDYEQYKEHLTRNRTAFRIVKETKEPDGSIVVKVIKQYNQLPCSSTAWVVDDNSDILPRLKRAFPACYRLMAKEIAAHYPHEEPGILPCLLLVPQSISFYEEDTHGYLSQSGQHTA